MSCMGAETLLLFLLISTFIPTLQGQETPNFEGSFDSTGFQDNEVEEQYEEIGYEDEEQDMLQFSQHLGEFIPDQTFTFKLQPNSEEKFAIWPGATVSSVRGMFHCEVDWNEDTDYETGGYADLTVMDGSAVAREFKHQRLGVFNHPHNLKDNKFHFIFKSHEAPVEIYFSYEMITHKKQEGRDSNITDMAKVLGSFTRVSSLLMQQEHEMNRLMEMGDKHTARLRVHMEELYWRGVVEGLVLVCSAGVSLWTLKRQIYSQYQSLV